MQNVQLDDYHKDQAVAERDVDLDADSDVQQVQARNYDPHNDQRDMRRLGKKQELKRRFRFFSVVGFVVVLGLTWEFSLTTLVFNLGNGGTAGAIWLVLVVCCCMFFVMLSMAELASMAPTSGGQYHWVSEFAPPHLQRILSYAVGWLCALGWQCAMPTVAFIGAQQVLALIVICTDGSYVIQGWHTSLMTMAFVLSAISFNTFAIGKLPVLEGLAVVLHIFGFFAFIVIMWTMGPRADAKMTFTNFTDANGWGSVGLATMIGMVGPTTTYLGADSAVHLAEELKDASYVLPRAMFSAAIINYILGFVTTVTFMFNLGDLDAILESTTGQPWVAALYAITGSKAGTIVLIVIMTVMYFFCAVNQVTTSSRQVFAFARDKGLPFHEFLSRVRPNGVPANSVYVTLVFTCLLALIVIGSTAAFNIILSVSATGLFTSYLIVIFTVLVKRLKGEKFPPSQFSLGIWGIPVNIIAICFLIVAYLFLFFPAVPKPDPASMNWAVLVYGVVVIFAFVYYFAVGRHHYDGPVSYVRKEYDER